MATAYTPGLKVTSRIRHRCVRQLPIPGTVKVEVGTTVGSRDIVAETFMPGDVTPINLANILNTPPVDIPEFMLKKEGDAVEKDEIIARSKGIFGMFKREYRSPSTGTLETVSAITGQLMMRGAPLPVQVQAYLSGEVVEVLAEQGCVIEADVSFVQGIFGIGGEAYGPIRTAVETHTAALSPDRITSDMQGAVVIGGARVSYDTLIKARDAGVAAVVAGGIDDQDLKRFLGYDLGVAITGTEDVGLTVIVTEGFGEISMAARTFELLASRAGDEASVNGATQIRAGVMRPEILIPLTGESARIAEPAHSDGALVPGMAVRIIRDPYFGLIGAVAGLPAEPQVLESGSKARVLEVKLESGESVVVPRANVESIQT